MDNASVVCGYGALALRVRGVLELHGKVMGVKSAVLGGWNLRESALPANRLVRKLNYRTRSPSSRTRRITLLQTEQSKVMDRQSASCRIAKECSTHVQYTSGGVFACIVKSVPRLLALSVHTLRPCI